MAQTPTPPTGSLTQNDAEAFCDALAKDLAKPRLEVLMAEVGSVVDHAIKSAEQVEEWAKPEYPEVPDWQKGWQPALLKAPKGTVLIISPWNYPIVLSFQPLIGAIAAGCRAVIKPSEVVPHCSQLIAELLPKYLDPSTYFVVNGAIAEASKLLELPDCLGCASETSHSAHPGTRWQEPGGSGFCL